MIRKFAAYVILGINAEGKKEVLTISVGEGNRNVDSEIHETLERSLGYHFQPVLDIYLS